MDPFSQGFIGASLAQLSATKKDFIKTATICGLIGGVLPDADIFIRSSEDTLLSIEYHRHFTHAIAFIPIGGLVAALICILLFKIFRKDLSFKNAFIFATLGYATHGLLDAGTSYGTHLAWPFSNHRTSWSIISVVDLLFTIPLIIAVLLTLKTAKKKYIKIFFVFAALYLSLGLLQNNRVTSEMLALAESRGHKVDHYEVKPTIGNNILWRTTYRTGDKIYVDAIRSNWWGSIKTYEGENMEAIIFPQDYSNINENSVLYNDLKRFHFFSNDLVGVRNDFPNTLIDARYSTQSNGTKPMWGLVYDQLNDSKHGKFISFHRGISSRNSDNFIDKLKGK